MRLLLQASSTPTSLLLYQFHHFPPPRFFLPHRPCSLFSFSAYPPIPMDTAADMRAMSIHLRDEMGNWFLGGKNQRSFTYSFYVSTSLPCPSSVSLAVYS